MRALVDQGWFDAISHAGVERVLLTAIKDIVLAGEVLRLGLEHIEAAANSGGPRRRERQTPALVVWARAMLSKAICIECCRT